MDEKGTMITLYGERNLVKGREENAIYAALESRSSYGNMEWEKEWGKGMGIRCERDGK